MTPEEIAKFDELREHVRGHVESMVARRKERLAKNNEGVDWSQYEKATHEDAMCILSAHTMAAALLMAPFKDVVHEMRVEIEKEVSAYMRERGNLQ